MSNFFGREPFLTRRSLVDEGDTVISVHHASGL